MIFTYEHVHLGISELWEGPSACGGRKGLLGPKTTPGRDCKAPARCPPWYQPTRDIGELLECSLNPLCYSVDLLLLQTAL